jgi:syntaxin 16
MDDKDFKVTFTDGQMKQVAQMDDLVSQRQRDIKQIAKSINEIAAIFKDLAVLVIEQGTMLDRIDFNIEQTQHHVEVGFENLKAVNSN